MSLAPIFSRFSAFGFSGSRSSVPVCAAAAAAVVPSGSLVFLGCAGGVDRFFRSQFPAARVFSASSFGSGRGAFAARSVAVVRAVAGASGVWVSFPSGVCPVGLVPSSSSSRCFCGSGSGSWASLAFAVGSSLPCAVFAPFGVPAGWGFSPVSGCPGWFGVALVPACSPVQLSLF